VFVFVTPNCLANSPPTKNTNKKKKNKKKHCRTIKSESCGKKIFGSCVDVIQHKLFKTRVKHCDRCKCTNLSEVINRKKKKTGRKQEKV
jgi:hypothetical protein